MSTQLLTSSLFFENKSLPVFGRQSGLMRERMGYCTTATGKPVECPKCNHDCYFLHQYSKYVPSNVCCGTCYSVYGEH